MSGSVVFNRCGFCKAPDTSFNGRACSRQCYNDHQMIRRYRNSEAYERWHIVEAKRIVRRGHWKPDRVDRAWRILRGEHMPTPNPPQRVRQIFEERGWHIWWLDER